MAKQNDRQRSRVNQRDERKKKVFIKKQEKEDVRKYKKTEKEIFIKPKPITKISTINKRIVDEKPLKDTIQKYINLFIVCKKVVILLNKYNYRCNYNIINNSDTQSSTLQSQFNLIRWMPVV